MPKTKQPTDIFLHIPKTAGTTLNHIMERHYPPHQIFSFGPVDGVEAFTQLPLEQRHAFRLVRGHMAFGLHAYVRPPYRYFTMLRKPVERVISYYYFMLERPEHYLHNSLHENRMGLEAFVASGWSTMAENAQTRMLSGVYHGPPGFGELDETVLEAAKRNLREQFVTVGLTERFDESLLLLRRYLGWNKIYYQRQNVTRKRPSRRQISPQTLAVIRAHNQLDLELYDYARALMDAQIEAYGPVFQQDLVLFKRKNRLSIPLQKLYWRIRQVSVRAYLKKGLARLTAQEKADS
jgi:hypothetical protein